MKQLENLGWSPHWVSHLGCIKGCLDYLGLDISNAWLFGGTGHAFVINLHEEVCPSGPTAWKTEMLFKLGRNLGYDTDGVFGFKGNDDFAVLQRSAWEHAREKIDQGVPCYGWELEIPEFYVVYGYDDGGYYFSGPGCDEGKGPKPWQELGDTGIGVVEMYSVSPGRAANDCQTVREALAFALEHAANPGKWIFDGYRAGLAGYDNWIAAVEGGTASAFGMAYNAAVWAECRGYAVQFLREAQERMGSKVGSLLNGAVRHYGQVSESLSEVAELYPFSPEIADDPIRADDRNAPAVGALRRARETEAAGLQVLASIVEALGRS
jgi:hypothetical protein